MYHSTSYELSQSQKFFTELIWDGTLWLALITIVTIEKKPWQCFSSDILMLYSWSQRRYKIWKICPHCILIWYIEIITHTSLSCSDRVLLALGDVMSLVMSSCWCCADEGDFLVGDFLYLPFSPKIIIKGNIYQPAIRCATMNYVINIWTNKQDGISMCVFVTLQSALELYSIK